jgi:predicted nucleotidyltransferase
MEKSERPEKSEKFSTRAQRERTLIPLLDEKLEWIRLNATDDLRYDRQDPQNGLRSRAVAWRLGNAEFLLTYHEVAEVPGSALFRARTQPYVAAGVADVWVDLGSLGDLDAALRAAKKEKGLTAADLKAIRHSRKHEGPAPEGLILVGLTGSHAYGLNHEGFTHPETGVVFEPSDVDTRGVFVVPTRAVLSLEKPGALVEQKDTDTTFDEVERFLSLCLKGNPERLEMLASPKTLVTEEGKWLEAHQRLFLSKRLIKTYGGYARQQLYRIESKGERSGKPMMHLIRLLITGTRILKDGVVDCDMRAHRDRLLAIRFGLMPVEEVFAWHQTLEIAFAHAAETTTLPDEPDVEQANRILLDIRRNHLSWD